MTDSDHELMRRLQSGDTSAFEELVRRWQAPLGRVLRRLVSKSGARASQLHGAAVNGAPQLGGCDSDDLSQEVFLRVYQARDRYRPAAEFSTWLFQIAINAARDAGRRRQRKPSVSLNGKEHAIEQQPCEDADAANKARDLERRTLVSDALQELPQKLREPLVLRHYSELTFDQIANVLKAPCTTIKSRVHLALKQLEAELRRLGLDESDLEP